MAPHGVGRIPALSAEREEHRLPYRPALSGKGLFAVVVWGGSFVATKIAMTWLNPFALVAARFLIGTLLLVAALRLREGRVWPAARDIPAGVLLGAILGAHLLIQAYGLQYTSAISTGWIIGFMPVTIALGAILLRQQRLGPVGWTGVALGTAGILVVWLSSSPDFAHARFGDLLQIGSCLTWTVYTLASAGPVARNGVLRVTGLAMGVAAVLCAAATPWTGVFTGPAAPGPVAALLFLGLVCSGAAFWLWFAAVREHGPSRTGALLYIEPFVASATGRGILAERLRAPVILGGLCVLAGVWLVTKDRRPGAAVAREAALLPAGAPVDQPA
jgi:drug/metabolite transporter (DMT)-like permease